MVTFLELPLCATITLLFLGHVEPRVEEVAVTERRSDETRRGVDRVLLRARKGWEGT